MRGYNIEYCDIVLGVQHGDEGKGKVTHQLLKNGNYTHCVRYNGGCNAGHTIYHNGQKFVTHHIPAGVFFGVKSLIGSGCVLNPAQFFKEIKMLEDAGIEVDGLVKIAHNTHIIQRSCIQEDGEDVAIGTTRTGNGPAYRKKHNRSGVRAVELPELSRFIVDPYDEFFKTHNCRILMEGAQGFSLDIDWGDYPYVTSSHCSVAAALQNGIPWNKVRHVYGVAKIYETYVGAKKFQPEGEVFEKIQDIGQEFGATTGRVRQCNWLDTNALHRAVDMNGVTHLIFNKVDILREVGIWRTVNPTIKFNLGEKQMIAYLTRQFDDKVEKIFFSDSPESI